MAAILLLVGLVASPFVLWALGFNTLAAFAGLFFVLSIPSIIHAVYLMVKYRTLLKIVGGPGFSWAGEPVTVERIKTFFKKAQ